MDVKAEFSVTLGGVNVPLSPAHHALALLEKRLGRTLFSLVDVGKSDGFTLDQLELMILAMAAEHSAIIPEKTIIDRRYGSLQSIGLGAAIVDAGIMTVTAKTLMPLVAALSGATDSNGHQKVEG